MGKLAIQLAGSGFELVNLLTESGQACIYSARSTAGGPDEPGYSYVFKVYKGPMALPVRQNEAQVLEHLADCGASVATAVGLLEYYDPAIGRPPEGPSCGLLFRYLKGKDLSGMLAEQGGPGFGPDEVATWTVKLCKILDEVHRHGIIHRDLKPGNILWDPDKHVIRLIDFGSAVFLDGPECPLSYTPQYCSPQCLAGDPPRRTDDIYSLGVTIFELLAGKHEFPVEWVDNLSGPAAAGQLKGRLLELDVQAEFDRRVLFQGGHKDLAARFAQVVQRCLDPDPEKRFQTAKQVSSVLRPPLDTLTGSIRTEVKSAWAQTAEFFVNRPKWPVRRRPAMMGSMLGLAAVVLIAGWPRNAGIIPPPESPTNAIPAARKVADTAAEFAREAKARSQFENSGATLPEPPSAAAKPGKNPGSPSPPAGLVAVRNSNSPVVPVNPPPPVQASALGESGSPVPKVVAPSGGSPFDPAAKQFVNSLGMVFKPVPTASGPVWFCTGLTSVSQFNRYRNSAAIDVNPVLKQALQGPGDQPVRQLTWDQASDFCGWLTAADRTAGSLPPNGRYRLPRAGEWSAGAEVVAPGGAEWCEDSFGSTSQLKLYRLNASWGHDRMGNSAGDRGFRCVLEVPSGPALSAGRAPVDSITGVP